MSAPAMFTATINIAKNVDWSVAFQLQANVSGDVIDLTGSILKMQIRKLETDHEALVEVASPTSGDGITLTDPANGMFQIDIPKESFRGMNAGEYVHDLVWIHPDGHRDRIWAGSAFVVEGVTR